MKDAGEQFHEGIPESDHLTVVVSEGWISGVRRSDDREGEDEELLNLFTKHSHHQISPCCTVPRHVSTRKIRQEYFQEHALHPRDDLRRRNSINQSLFLYLLLQALPTAGKTSWMYIKKTSEQPFGYTVLNLHPTSDDRKSVFSHLSDLSTRRIPTLASKKKRGCLIIDQNGILKISLIDSAHLKNAVLGEGRLKKNDHGWSFNR